MTNESVRVAAFAGSLRKGSFNKALVRAATELAPRTMTIEVVDLGEVPLYDADVEAEGDPEPVRALKRAIGEADGLLIATPEYNHGLPAVTKNAVDWASRPPRDSVLNGLPVAVMGATPGGWGTARAQSILRQSFVFTDSPCMRKPEMLVARAREKFDDDGRLTDEKTRKYLKGFLESFGDFVRREGRGR
ncbi:MAG: NAD(P)H-dependent oxidoreductase [Gemmatimonadota bacterium]|nr:NAD(P)H-dependent oxidoreductase [Gemmatimonadota bacterium]